ncbi:caspase family protein, partial [bacterium]|nr:caspase family protein [bacterium]
DVGDEVKESDEQNNEKTYEIRVKARYMLKEEAEEIVIDTLAKPSEAPLGMRVYSYPKLLTKGSRIEPYYNWIEEKDGFIVCDDDCWFFWIDDDPYAQFAHSTRYVMIDAHTKEVTIKEAEWWPVIDDDYVWGTTEERKSDDYIIFEVTRDIYLDIDWKHIFPSLVQPECELWAVIVCGSNDPGNTFEEDTDYIYDVLTGLGYPDDNIFYTSPFTSDPGVDKATNIANVQWAFNQVAANSDSEDKVFIFYSAHGGIDSLQCDPGASGGGHVSATDMDNWLDNIAAHDIIVLLQGCRTGSFIGSYSDGTIVTSENELTGDGETNRIVMTATDTDHSSYGGSSNWGSTFTGGYVASFGDATADVDADNKISVDEAYDYAWDNDQA